MVVQLAVRVGTGKNLGSRSSAWQPAGIDSEWAVIAGEQGQGLVVKHCYAVEEVLETKEQVVMLAGAVGDVSRREERRMK